MSRKWCFLIAPVLGFALVVGACAGDPERVDALPPLGSDERCEANQAAGKLIFLSGFDFAAAAGILDIVAAEAEGYFDEMCLDVQLQSGLSPANSAALAAGTTQFAVIASFGEMVRQNVNGGTDLMAFAQLGHTSISELIVPAGTITSLSDLQGKTIGIKGDLPSPVQAMLAAEGAQRGTFEELLLDGFDPVAHLALGIDALPVYKSNEPAALDREGIEYVEFDPLDFDIPASFAVYISSRENYEKWPTAIEDFVRAGLRGYRFAAENPEVAVAHAFELINAAGNQFWLAETHELSRWRVERSMVENVTPEGFVVGQLNTPRLGEEIQLLADLGELETLPDWESMLEDSVVPKLHDDNGELIWVPMD